MYSIHWRAHEGGSWVPWHSLMSEKKNNHVEDMQICEILELHHIGTLKSKSLRTPMISRYII